MGAANQPFRTAGAAVLIAAAGLLLASAALAADAPSAAPDGPSDGAWTAVLAKGLADGSDLAIELRTSAGRIIQAWAQSPGSNAAHNLDPSGLRLEGQALRGTVPVNIHHVLHRYDLDLKADGRAIVGSFRGTCGLSDIAELAGDVAGDARLRTGKADAARFDLRLERALPGMTGAIAEARVAFAWKDGRPQDATIESTTGRKPAPHWSGKVDAIEMAYDGRTLRGTISAAIDPTGFLWSGGGLYTMTLQAEQTGNFLHGGLATRKGGKEVGRGRIAGAVEPKADAAPGGQGRAFTLTLAGAMDGREDVTAHLECRDGAFTGVAVAPGGATHRADASALRLDGDRLRGTLRLSIDPAGWGRGDQRPLAATLEMDATVKDGAVRGTYKGRYAAAAVEGAVGGRRRTWDEVAAENTFAPGLDFPCWRGPYGNGSSPPSGRDLVESLADMRLLWKSEARLPDSWIWSADPIGAIVGGYCTPLVAAGRVYVFYYVPSGPVVESMAESIRERDRDRWRDKYRIDADDVFECIDAATGRTLWRHAFAGKGINYNKTAGAGPFMTPCVAGGRVFGIGSAGAVYALDAATGAVAWQTSLGPAAQKVEEVRQRCREAPDMPAMNRDFCSAPVVADGVVVCNDNAGGLVGLDAASGDKVWGPVAGCTVKSSSPIRWRHKGRDYVIVSSDYAVCIEPRTGKVLWEAPGASGQGAVAVTEDAMVCAAGSPAGGPAGPSEKDSGLSAYRIGLTGASLLWCLGRGYNNHVTSPVIYEGHVYAFSDRATICVDLASGKIVGESEFPGTRTCSSLVVADGRVLRENLYQRFYFASASPKDFRRLGPIWTPPSHAENTTSTIVDGRLFIRGRDGLYCYDMRKAGR